MSITEFLHNLVGSWTGYYHLWLAPGAPVDESSTAASVRLVASGRYAEIVYSWYREGKEQGGIFLLGGADGNANATWGDSFHSQPDPMHCPGRLANDGYRLIFDGSYPVGPGEPDWGWRTEFVLKNPDTLLMEAYNITPTGDEHLAVRAEYQRAIQS